MATPAFTESNCHSNVQSRSEIDLGSDFATVAILYARDFRFVPAKHSCSVSREGPEHFIRTRAGVVPIYRTRQVSKY